MTDNIYKYHSLYDFKEFRQVKRPKWRVNRLLLKKKDLRKLFITIYAIGTPERYGRIYEKGNFTFVRKTGYNYIKKLEELNLINRIPVVNIYNKDNLTKIEKIVKEKFETFISQMTEKQKKYYQLKTGYYYVTEYGEEFIDFACKQEGIKKKKEVGNEMDI